MMSDSVQKSTAKVVSLIDTFRVVINRGSVDGVREGQTYVFYALGKEIFDLETQESLGILEVLKGRGSVVHVQERISIVQSTKQKQEDTFSGALGINVYGIGPNRSVRYVDLPFDGVKVGDFARPV